eukprot:superscaffoldBa00000056_g934
MDPADTDLLHQALVGQGALLGQHNKALTTLLTELSRTLLNLQSQLTVQNSQQAPSPLQAARSPSPPPCSCSIAEMAIEFCTFAAENGWNGEALQGAFQNTLTETIKYELVSRDEPCEAQHLFSYLVPLSQLPLLPRLFQHLNPCSLAGPVSLQKE